MRRRDLILGLAALAIYPVAQASAAGGLYRIGVLDPKARERNRGFGRFEDVLRAFGNGIGRHLGIEYRSPGGHNETFSALAEELVRLDVDLLVTCGTQAALEAARSQYIFKQLRSGPSKALQ